MTAPPKKSLKHFCHVILSKFSKISSPKRVYSLIQIFILQISHCIGFLLVLNSLNYPHVLFRFFFLSSKFFKISSTKRVYSLIQIFIFQISHYKAFLKVLNSFNYPYRFFLLLSSKFFKIFPRIGYLP